MIDNHEKQPFCLEPPEIEYKLVDFDQFFQKKNSKEKNEKYLRTFLSTQLITR